MEALYTDLREVFEAVKEHKITSEEGKKIISQMKQQGQNDDIVTDETLAREYDGMSRAVVLQRPESVKDVTITKVEEKEPAPHEIVILTKACSLNFGDYLCVRGLYPNMPQYPFIPGFEVAGTVVKVGTAVTKFKKGDDVIALMGEKLGGHQEFAITNEQLAVKKPSNISFEEASAFPIVFLTVHHVFELARIKKGDKVLIQTAAGGIGLIAVQMAMNLGATVYATAGSKEKLSYLESMGVKHLINYREVDFEEEIIKMTDHYGVDVVLNTLSGDAIQKGLNILAPVGRYVEIAMAGLKSSSGFDLSHLVDNQTFYGVDLRRLLLNKPALISEYLEIMKETLESGTIKPTVCKVFPLTDIKEAYESMDKRENIGKIIVVNDRAKELEEQYRKEEKQEFSTDDIAIIGVAGQFPGAKNIDQFWENLANGVCSIQEIPMKRFDISQYYDEDRRNLSKTYCKWGGMLSDIDQFDALFFNMSGKEAEVTDPQQRLFMEECWNALEDSGYSSEELSGMKCSVFAGVGSSDYMMSADNTDGKEPQSLWGTESSIVPARISYFLNLKGPAVAVNTACSSSLVALDLACENIWSGESKMAVVGGAFLVTTPAFYIATSNAGMLSPTGVCSAFDSKANGFVPGEGAAAVVLKLAKDAIRDHDNIYGVIKGIGINQDGKTNGITAPSSKSQTELLTSVYKKFQINSEEITYVETHGTGTKLGDPIEFSALTTAFKTYTNELQYCGIGSVKTNIGHASAAAGMASLIKVLLCMKHKQLVPSLNYTNSNEIMNVEQSPFYINTERKEWNSGTATNRMAAISSFGFSGTNAHVVLESYERSLEKEIEQPYYVLAFSAKSEHALRDMLERFVSWNRTCGSQVSIQDIAYTLAKGRTCFHYRKAFVAESREDASNQIEQLLKQETQIGYSSVTEEIDGENEDTKLLEILKGAKENPIIYKKCMAKIADVFEQGNSAFLKTLYANQGYWKVSLPTYPFEKERYWFETSTPKKNKKAAIHQIQSLLDENVSDFSEVYYKKTLTVDDTIIKNHRVRSNFMLPAVATLEMAAQAVKASTLEDTFQIRNVVWASPIVLNEGKNKEIYISLYEEDDKILYEVWTNKEERKIYTQGEVKTRVTSSEQKQLHMLEIRNRLHFHIDQQECYQKFSIAGIVYSQEFVSIEDIFVNDTEVLAKLRKTDEKDFYFDNRMVPYLIDGAIQSLIGFTFLEKEDSEETYIPFQMGEMNYYQDIRTAEYAYARRKEGKQDVFHIDLIDADGRVVLEIKDLFVRKIKMAENHAKVTLYKEHLILEQGQKNQTNLKEQVAIVFANTNHIIKESAFAKVIKVSYGEEYQKLNDTTYRIHPDHESDYEQLFRQIKNDHPICNYILNYYALLAKDYKFIHEIYTNTVYMIRGLVHAKYPMVELYTVLKQNKEQLGLCHAVNGMYQSVEREGIRVKTHVVSFCDAILDTADILEKELTIKKTTDSYVSYVNGQRHSLQLQPIEQESLDCMTHWKEHGVYIIVGGSGKLGKILASSIISKYAVTVILTGRSNANADIDTYIESMNDAPGKLIYKQADVLNVSALEQLKEEAHKLGTIQGIIYMAGVLNDSMLMNKNIYDAEKVLDSKCMGIINVDQAFKNEQLEFFLIYSSMASILGNAGQTDYAYANGFLADFALYRTMLVENGKSSGITQCIHWPLWKDGGMQLSQEAYRQMEQHLGIVPMDSQTGIEVVNYVLQSQAPVTYVLYGTKSLVENEGNEKHISDTTQRSVIEGVNQEQKAGMNQYLKQILSDEIRISSDRINVKASLDEYGVDSTMILNLTSRLEEDFGELSKTLLFEYQTLEELGEYLLQNYREVASKLVQKDGKDEPLVKEEDTKQVSEQMKDPTSPKKHMLISFKDQQKSKDTYVSSEPKTNQQWAIVGLAGTYPMAENLDEFWSNLCEGKDCITDMPSDRWDRSKWDAIMEESGVYCSKGGFIDEIDAFDTKLFNISPREAVLIDPQERLMLQSVWHALEDAGYTREFLNGKKVGVFIGVMYGHYQLYGADGKIEGTGIPASSFASIANRISYYFNFSGPSIAVDTMCSSSLTAIHMAKSSLLKGECDIAIVGGVNVVTHPYKYMMLCQGKFSSKDGTCRSFGKDGTGYVPGEGVGAIVLTELSEAQKMKDLVYGVIKGSAINHGGKTNGFSVPNPKEQANVIEQAFEDALLSPNQVSYIETHGTGTSLGDPIEITGLEKSIGKGWAKTEPCAIGSVKSNIGHLESAAGMASLTKVLLQMKYGKLVPSIHSEELNPNINFKQSHFYVQHSLQEWKEASDEQKRIAGISAFGAGGSNAHILVEEYKSNRCDDRNDEKGEYIFVFSAQTAHSLEETVRNMKNYITLHTKGEQAGNSASTEVQSRLLERLASILQVEVDDIMVQDTLMELGAEIKELIQIQEMLSQEFGIKGKVVEASVRIQNLIDLCVTNQEVPSTMLDTNPILLKDIEYTLIVGREAMNHRLSIIATSMEDLLEKMGQYLRNPENEDLLDTYMGYKKTAITEEVTQPIICDIKEAAELWCQQESVDLSTFIEEDARKISLPGYSFEKKKYWITKNQKIQDRALTTDATSAVLSKELTKAELQQHVELQLKTIISEVLNMDIGEIESDTNYSEFGFESITLKEFADRFTAFYEIELMPTIFYSKTNIEQLSQYIVDEYEEQIRNRMDQNHVTGNGQEQMLSIINDFTKAESSRIENEPVAIIGMFGKFPESNDPEEYFKKLVNEEDLIREIPLERWDYRDFHPDYTDGTMVTKVNRGGFIKDADKFDPKFFKLSPAEAVVMDPQQRVFLEVVWKAVEDSGYKASDLSGKKVGIFAGVQSHDYQHLLASSGETNPMMGLGNEHSILVNRISYLMNLNGPSEAYNTACSSSSVAIHRAVQSIKNSECEMAVAGGVSLNLSPYPFISADQMGMLSPNGECRTLDASANGYVRGEGAGVIVLKSLEKAKRDHDHIYAIIRGSGVNHGGKAASITAPNSDAQANLLMDVYEKAGVTPDTISYLELHGTGTELGDPIEIEGIKKAFGDLAKKENLNLLNYYCGIGSVKTNIGHLEPASGVAGVIKVVKALEHKKLPGLLHLTKLNPYIRLENSPFYIVEHTKDWEPLFDQEKHPIPLRAGVSSFGFGGVNSHILLEEYIDQEQKQPEQNGPYLFSLSAKNEDRLMEYAKNMLTFLQNKEKLELNDFCYTLLSGREAMEARLAILFDTKKELEEKLVKFSEGSILKTEKIFIAMNKSGKSPKKELQGETFRTSMNEIAEQWAHGDNFDFYGCFGADTKRSSIPTYPFADERYWVDAKWDKKDQSTQIEIGEEIAKYNDIPLTGSGYDFIEQSLTTILAETLKMPKDELDPELDFSEYGVDSILLSVILSVVQQCFEISLSINILVENCTVHSLANYIYDHTEGTFDMTHLLRKDISANQSGIPLEILPFNTEGSYQASFWIHGAPGYATFFRDLADALGKEYPVYAFQAKGVNGKEMPQLIYEMAQHYVDCIKAVQPEGPYVIGGYSYGGLVAYEMAQILHEAGDEITSLVMFDTMPATQEMNDLYNGLLNGDDDSFVKLLMANEFAEVKNTGADSITRDDLKDINPKMHTYYLAKLIKEKSGKPIDVEEIYSYLNGTLEVVSFSEESYAVYHAKPYTASPVLFMKAQKGFIAEKNFLNWNTVDFGKSYDYVQPWKELIQDLHIALIPSDHFSGLEEPALDVLVEQTKRMIPKKGEMLIVKTEDETSQSTLVLEEKKQPDTAGKKKRPGILPMRWVKKD